MTVRSVRNVEPKTELVVRQPFATALISRGGRATWATGATGAERRDFGRHDSRRRCRQKTPSRLSRRQQIHRTTPDSVSVTFFPYRRIISVGYLSIINEMIYAKLSSRKTSEKLKQVRGANAADIRKSAREA